MGKTKTAFVSDAETKDKKPKSKDSAKGGKIHIAGLKGGQRIKTVEVEPVVAEKKFSPTEVTEVKGKKSKIKVRGKKYKDAKAKIKTGQLYKLSEAVKLVKEASFSNFDETFELHLVLKKAGFNTNVKLPYSQGRKKTIEIANDETIKKLQSGKIDFDVLLATADMMPKLVPFAKVLGPKGLMPNPKTGTLIKNPNDAKKFSANSLTIKTEKDFPLIHTVIGKASQKDSELIENAEAIIEAVNKNQIVKVYLKSTMSPSVKLAIF